MSLSTSIIVVFVNTGGVYSQLMSMYIHGLRSAFMHITSIKATMSLLMLLLLLLFGFMNFSKLGSKMYPYMSW